MGIQNERCERGEGGCEEEMEEFSFFLSFLSPSLSTSITNEEERNLCKKKKKMQFLSTFEDIWIKSTKREFQKMEMKEGENRNRFIFILIFPKVQKGFSQVCLQNEINQRHATIFTEQSRVNNLPRIQKMRNISWKSFQSMNFLN